MQQIMRKRELKTLTIFLFVASAVLGLFVGAVCSGCEFVEWQNAELIETEEGIAVFPYQSPMRVTATDHSMGDDLDVELVQESIAWWHEEVNRRDLQNERVWFDWVGGDAGGATVFVQVAQIAAELDDDGFVSDDAYGLTHLIWNEEGAIVFCLITLNVDYSYHRPTMERTLRHELGHCAGYADDPPSEDHESVMSSPTPYRYGLLQEDWELRRDYGVIRE